MFNVAATLTVLIAELRRDAYILGACELSATTSPDRHILKQGGGKKIYFIRVYYTCAPS